MKKILVLGGAVLILLAPIGTLSLANSIAERPIWQINDTWTFQRSVNGKFAYFFTLTVIDTKARLGSKECYRVEYKSFSKDGKIYDQYLSWQYFSSEFVYLGRENRNGTFERPFGGNKIQNFKWPLKNKEYWEQPWSEPGFSGQITSIFWVSTEKIAVPAGEFEAFKILHEFQFAFGKGRNYNEHWYSPEVKYVVRQYFHHDGSVHELISYQVAK